MPEALGLGPVWPAVLGLGYGVLAGMAGNDLRRAALAARGYRLVEVVVARNRAQALIRYAEAAPFGPAMSPRAAPAAAGARAPGALDLGPSPGFWS